MGKRGRLYSPEFKEEAVRLVHSSNERYPVAKIARDLDVSTETLRKWVNQAQIDAGEPFGNVGEGADHAIVQAELLPCCCSICLVWLTHLACSVETCSSTRSDRSLRASSVLRPE
jgi:transposase-like protein